MRVTASDGHGAESVAADVFRLSLGSRTVTPAAAQDGEVTAGSAAAPTSFGQDGAVGSGRRSAQPAPTHGADGLLERFLEGFDHHDMADGFRVPALNQGGPEPQRTFGQQGPGDEMSYGGQDFERCWAALSRAMDRLDEERRGSAVPAQTGHGADLSGLMHALTGGGAQAMRGSAAAVTLVSESLQLKVFAGLREGAAALARW